MIQYAADYIPKMQEGRSESGLAVYRQYTDIIYVHGIFPVVLFGFYAHRTRCAYYFFIWNFMHFIIDITKMGFMQPRPIWITKDVMSIYCSAQFGNPSGHAMTAITFSMTMWADYFVSCQSGPMKKPIVKYTILVIGCVMWFTVGYGRVIVGVHSWC